MNGMPVRLRRGFASDNNSGIHPAILEAIARSNEGHCVGYGDDPFTSGALARFGELFGDGIDVHFVFTGTGANVLGLAAACSSFESIITTSLSHLNLDECGAPENFIGAKLCTLQTADGKMKPAQLEPCLLGRGDQHHSQPRTVSVTQSTELGTVYAVEEIESIARFAREHDLYLHMDGARIANAAAHIGCGLRRMTRDAGVDILSFGGTKNGMMIGEAVVIFNRDLAHNFKYIRKQGMQLASKMRFISAQFDAYLTDDLWLKNARRANAMARLLADHVRDIAECSITQKVESNAVFVTMPDEIVEDLRKEFFFYSLDWGGNGRVHRLMASFDTEAEDILGVVLAIKRLLVQKKASGDRRGRNL